MPTRSGRTVAVGLLCAIAATIAVWSGPLEAASSALHTGAPAVAVAHTTSAHVTH
jgi:hypothetical protein